MRLRFMLLFLLFLSGLVACQPLSTDQKDEVRTLRIAWIPKALDNPVFELGRKGAFQRAAELSTTGNVKVEVIYTGSVSSDAMEQARVVEDMIARKVDAIAISCNDPIACINPINQAVDAGIPVITWDSDSPQSKRFAYLGVNNVEGGKQAAKLLIEAMGESGKIAILTGVPGAYNLEERIRGFREVIDQYPDIKVVAVRSTNDDINLSVQVVEETMQAFPDLNGWFFVGMWPLLAGRGSMPLWEQAALKGNLKTVSWDTMPEELEFLKDGYLSGLIDQNCWAWGYDTIQILYDKLVYGKSTPDFIDAGLRVVTQKEVEAMMRLWETGEFLSPGGMP